MGTCTAPSAPVGARSGNGVVRADLRVPELVAVLIGASHAIEQGADTDTRARVLAIVSTAYDPASVRRVHRARSPDPELERRPVLAPERLEFIRDLPFVAEAPTPEQRCPSRSAKRSDGTPQQAKRRSAVLARRAGISGVRSVCTFWRVAERISGRLRAADAGGQVA